LNLTRDKEDSKSKNGFSGFILPILYILIFSSFVMSDTPTFTITPTATETITYTATPISCDSEGNTHPGDYSTGGLTTGYMFASRYYLNAGSAQRISVYCASGAAGNISAAIYSDVSGEPGSVLEESAAQEMTDGWNDIPAAYNIASAGYYWLAFQFSTNGPFFNSDTLGVAVDSENTVMTGGAFPTWPASWGAGTNNTSLLSMYAVVCLQDTPTATPTATPPITFTLTPTPTFTPSVTFTNTGTPQPVATPIPTPGGLYSLAGNILTDGVVNAVASDASGVYLGGLFNYVGPRTGEGKIFNVSSSTMLAGMPEISGGASYGVETSIPDGAGGWYIGGDFTSVAGQPRAGIAHIFSDGVVDSNFNPGANGAVMILARDGAGSLFAGGFFTAIGGQNRTYIAKMNAVTGAIDNSFNPAVTGVYIQSLAFDSNQDIYVAGNFSTIAGQPLSCLAKLNGATAIADPAFAPNPNSAVHQILLDGNGSLYACGDFGKIGGQFYSMLAKVDATTGAADTNFVPVVDGIMQSMALDGSGSLFIGGWFTNVNTIARNYIAKISAATGALDGSFNPGADAAVYPIVLDGAGNIYAGGNFKNINGQSRGRIAKLDAVTGSVDASFAPYADNNVETIALGAAGNVFVGGLFNSIGGQPRTNIARLNAADLSIDPDFNVNCDNQVLCLLAGNGATGNGSLYAGGKFTTIASSVRPFIAKLDPLTGIPDPAFNPAAGSWVYALALDASQNLYVGGQFTVIDSVTRPHLAKINAVNGAVDSTFNAAGANSTVYSLALDGNGNLYAGGSFFNIGGLSRSLIAKLDTVSGSAETAFNATAAGTTVTTIALDGAGNIYAGGLFSTIGGITRNDIARLNASTGIADGTFTVTSDNALNALVTDGAGYIYAGGNFGAIGSQPMSYLVRIFMSLGTVDTGFAMQPNNSVNTLCFSPDKTTLYAGGSFTSFDGKGQANFAAVHMIAGIATPTLTYTLTATQTPTITLTITATPTPSDTFTITPTGTITQTASITQTVTVSPTITVSATESETFTISPTFTITETESMTQTDTVTPTVTETLTETNTFTATPTYTCTYTVTMTVTPTATATQTCTSTPAPDENNVLDRNYVDASNGGVVTIKVNVSYTGLPIGIKVYSLNGELVRKIDSLSYAAGWNSVVWDVKNDGGRTVGQGIYFVEINAQGVKKIRRIYVLK
jgi:flagellar hook assembly protein FlgD